MGQKIAIGILGTALPVASEPVCSIQDHMRSKLRHQSQARHVGRVPITVQTRELCPGTRALSRAPAVLHIFTLASSMTGYFQNIHYVQVHLLEVTTAD